MRYGDDMSVDAFRDSLATLCGSSATALCSARLESEGTGVAGRHGIQTRQVPVLKFRSCGARVGNWSSGMA
jgi:hypothetical protein